MPICSGSMQLQLRRTGARVEEIAGMTFYYRDENFLRNLFDDRFEIVSMTKYAEMEEDDSIYVIASSTKGA